MQGTNGKEDSHVPWEAGVKSRADSVSGTTVTFFQDSLLHVISITTSEISESSYGTKQARKL
jgi:hypothetical protein